MNERIHRMTLASVYPLYVAKVERKGRSQDELDAVITWFTGLDRAALEQHIARGSTFGQVFEAAELTAQADLITGVVCGVRVESIDDPLVQNVRRLDKLVDELARGRPLEKIRRS